MEGKVCIVTGANQGIGFTTARELALQKAHVILACRDTQKGEEARHKIMTSTGNNNVEVMELDLADFDSVRRFAAQFIEKGIPLHVLFNNASVFGASFSKTKNNYESHFQVNYLGVCLLIELLLEKLKESAPARILNVSSLLYWVPRMNFNHISNEKLYIHGILAYARSKMCLTTYSLDLAKQLEPSKVTVNLGIFLGLSFSNFQVDPLFVNTKSYRNSSGITKFMLKTFQQIFADKAGSNFAWAASDPSLTKVTGKYFVNRREIPLKWSSKNLDTQGELLKRTNKMLSL